MIIALIHIYFMSFSNTKNDTIRTALLHFLNIVLIISAFVLATKDINEISVRFSFYLYAMFPFIVILIPIKSSILTKSSGLVSAVLMVAFFIYRLENGTWEYANTGFLLINPMLSFLN
jgi:hypothetical protein